MEMRLFVAPVAEVISDGLRKILVNSEIFNVWSSGGGALYACGKM